MNHKHLTEEEFVDLHHDSRSPESQAMRERLEECETCREEYEALSATLQLTARFEPPELHPSRRVEIFENAWNRSRNLSVDRGWTVWAVLRHVCTFGIGIAVGMLMIVSQTAGSTGWLGDSTSQPRTIQTMDLIPQHLQSQALENIYSNLESPFLVVEENTENPQKSKRVLYGSTDNGAFQIVWNL